MRPCVWKEKHSAWNIITAQSLPHAISIHFLLNKKMSTIDNLLSCHLPPPLPGSLLSCQVVIWWCSCNVSLGKQLPISAGMVLVWGLVAPFVSGLPVVSVSALALWNWLSGGAPASCSHKCPGCLFEPEDIAGRLECPEEDLKKSWGEKLVAQSCSMGLFCPHLLKHISQNLCIPLFHLDLADLKLHICHCEDLGGLIF